MLILSYFYVGGWMVVQEIELRVPMSSSSSEEKIRNELMKAEGKKKKQFLLLPRVHACDKEETVCVSFVVAHAHSFLAMFCKIIIARRASCFLEPSLFLHRKELSEELLPFLFHRNCCQKSSFLLQWRSGRDMVVLSVREELGSSK